MIRLELNVDDFARRAQELGGQIDQLPYALATAMNTAALQTREYLAASTWPSHVQARNSSFMRAALRVEKATKGNLRVAILDTLGRGSLNRHADGGAKQGRGNLAIPVTRNVRKGAHGVFQSQRPKALANTFVVPGRGGGKVIYQRQNQLVGPVQPGKRVKGGLAKKKALRLMYVLRPTVTVKKDVPFREDFARVMRDQIDQAFPVAMALAMKSRRSR